jgi:hypothetical protein
MESTTPAGNRPTDRLELMDSGTNVQILSTKMHIRELSIERPAILAYLQTIAPDKLEVALVHAIEVGITEMVARRQRRRA